MDYDRLSGPQRKLLRVALEQQFPEPGQFDMFLVEADFPRLPRTGDDYPYRIFRLIGELAGQGRLSALMAELRRQRPGSPHLQDLDAQLALADDAADTQPVPARRGGLEKVVRGAGFNDLRIWANRLLEHGARICTIRSVQGAATIYGTGVLVGPDLVLTNHHVVEALVEGRADPAGTQCVFGFAETEAGRMEGERFDLAPGAAWRVAGAPYSRADLSADAGLPGKGELDFALLRLARRADAGRGHMDFARVEAPPAAGETVFILQHPDGAPIKQSTGEVIPGPSALRLRYDADTLGGSSGALVLNARLEPVALHHAGDPRGRLRAEYNQGIPLGPIRAAIEAAGVAWVSPPRRAPGGADKDAEKEAEKGAPNGAEKAQAPDGMAAAASGEAAGGETADRRARDGKARGGKAADGRAGGKAPAAPFAILRRPAILALGLLVLTGGATCGLTEICALPEDPPPAETPNFIFRLARAGTPVEGAPVTLERVVAPGAAPDLRRKVTDIQGQAFFALSLSPFDIYRGEVETGQGEAARRCALAAFQVDGRRDVLHELGDLNCRRIAAGGGGGGGGGSAAGAAGDDPDGGLRAAPSETFPDRLAFASALPMEEPVMSAAPPETGLVGRVRDMLMAGFQEESAGDIPAAEPAVRPAPPRGLGAPETEITALQRSRLPHDPAARAARAPLGLPEAQVVLDRRGYTLGFDPDRKLMSWAAFTLDPSKTGRARRPRWQFDPDLPDAWQTGKEAYANNIYDRGHMVSPQDVALGASQIERDRAAMEASYYSAGLPQPDGTNRGAWLMVEKLGREMAEALGPIHTISGPVWPPRTGANDPFLVIGPGKTPVPIGLFRVHLRQDAAGGWRAIGFIVPNDGSRVEDPTIFATSVDEIERRTGLIFFPDLNFSDALALKLETELEAFGAGGPAPQDAPAPAPTPTPTDPGRIIRPELRIAPGLAPERRNLTVTPR